MEEEKARCIASSIDIWQQQKEVSISVGVAAGATDGCCRNQEQQRISKKQKRRKSLDLLAVHTLLQKALANVDHYCLSKLVTQSIWADDNGIEWKKSDEASDQLGHDQAWLIDRPSMVSVCFPAPLNIDHSEDRRMNTRLFVISLDIRLSVSFGSQP
ncbi:hypothetical protein T12_7652 [Trichinella patagoniensis]|uniref:Uncharacterized protein n=1 Tax=Trichinella patagoniensis TaxID=990121 RepID=A0A0V0ZMC1_9BILA|nr:hypothetical protein T12_7652 [Trichinella patagoniensis]